MCGRFSLHLTDLAAVASALGVSLPPDAELPAWEPRYNVAPTQPSPIAIDDAEPTLTMARWGLLPHWAKDAGEGARAINARVESAADKPSFRDSWRAQRCIVPATGYFEWKRLDDGEREPMWIHREDSAIMRMAGLWSRWRSPGGERLTTFTVLTQAARGSVAAIHDRMPIELSKDGAAGWLAPVHTDAHARDVISDGTLNTEHLRAHPVGKIVGNPRNDSRACIEAVEPAPARQQLTFDELFGSGS